MTCLARKVWFDGHTDPMRGPVYTPVIFTWCGGKVPLVSRFSPGVSVVFLLTDPDFDCPGCRLFFHDTAINTNIHDAFIAGTPR